jgi:predicted PurR-regulated permease PerM
VEDDVRPAEETTGGGQARREEARARRLAERWAAARMVREARLAQQLPSPSAPVTQRGTTVPWGVEVAASYGWRFLIIVAVGAVLAYAVSFFAVLVIPVVIALLITALTIPVVSFLGRWLPRGVASILVVVLGIAFVVALLTFAGNQVANGASDLATQASTGLGQIRDWLKDGPLNASEGQINDYIAAAQDGLGNYASGDQVLTQVTELGTTLSHVFAGFFIVLFSTFFFLSDGARIWSWLVRLAPRAARQRVDSSGRVAWISLTQFVRATVIVAAVDAAGIMIVAAVLGVPFVAAIGVLVFIGAFIPLVGATVAGSVAVLVALVDQGPVTALFMLGGVILVQQIEGHILQPFLMGRWVSVHPLGVIIALAAGVLVAGIAGALVAVPFAAAVNAVVQHLAANTAPGDDPEEELDEDYAREGGRQLPEDADDGPITGARVGTSQESDDT